MRTTYRAVKFSQNSTNVDGSAIVERDCGHDHKSPATAERCRIKLLDYNKGAGTWSAAWHNSTIAHSDGTKCTPEELDEAWHARNEI